MLLNEQYPIFDLNISHTRKILVMGLIEQLISMNVMVEEKSNIFKKAFQKCFISTFYFDRKINPIELDVFTNHTKEIWYIEDKKLHKREELVNLIMKLYKSIKDNTFVLGDEMLSKRSGIIDIYCNYLSKNPVNIDLELIKTKVKAICEKLQVNYTQNIYTDLDSILEINKKYYTTLNKKEYLLIDFDKITHVEKDFSNFVVNKFKLSNGYYDFFSKEYKKRYLKSFFDTVNEYCKYLRTKESDSVVKPSQKEPGQRIKFSSIER
ncbi:17842_t:CDS:2 [Dentiscutata erythropus]|uniref:17842_t:CDS:1 n=1 Tax=Dentiscutata erythropus TaxID=1348616 RepID=A0A9N9EJJ1_9GLOM|nr:17842_t:CDS:2 [Dentiscutata erythropus]